MPEETLKQEQVLTLFVENFAAAWAVGNFDGALSWADMAQKRWNDLYAHTMQMRAKGQGIPWPLPGDPGADDVTGWDGWYGGGYGGALA